MTSSSSSLSVNDDDVTFFNDPKKTHTQIVSLPLLISPQDIFISIFLDKKKSKPKPKKEIIQN